MKKLDWNPAPRHSETDLELEPNIIPKVRFRSSLSTP
jgi:hypothetical protein